MAGAVVEDAEAAEDAAACAFATVEPLLLVDETEHRAESEELLDDPAVSEPLPALVSRSCIVGVDQL